MAKIKKETNKKEEKKEVVFITKELKRKETDSEEYVKVKAFFIILVIILVLLGLLALLNGNFVTKDYSNETTTTSTTTIAYDSSLLTVDRVFNVSDKNYLVLFYNSKDSAEKEYVDGLVGKYSSDTTKLYKVDMADPMNKAYYNENGTENTAPTSSKDIVITRTTLMTIKKKKVVKYQTDKAEIAKVLNTKKDE